MKTLREEQLDKIRPGESINSDRGGFEIYIMGKVIEAAQTEKESERGNLFYVDS